MFVPDSAAYVSTAAFSRGLSASAADLFAQLALPPGLDRREDPLAGLEIRRNRLPHLIAHADHDDDEDGDEQHARPSRT